MKRMMRLVYIEIGHRFRAVGLRLYVLPQRIRNRMHSYISVDWSGPLTDLPPPRGSWAQRHVDRQMRALCEWLYIPEPEDVK